MQAPGDEGPVRATVELDESFAVIQLDSVTPGELSEEDALRKQAYNQRLSITSGNTEAMGFLRVLRQQSVIQVYEDRL